MSKIILRENLPRGVLLVFQFSNYRGGDYSYYSVQKRLWDNSFSILLVFDFNRVYKPIQYW